MEPTAMDAGKILHELTYAEGLPKEALKAASAQRVEMLPLFVEEIETYLALEPITPPSQMQRRPPNRVNSNVPPAPASMPNSHRPHEGPAGANTAGGKGRAVP